jgi:hypothetical protein
MNYRNFEILLTLILLFITVISSILASVFWYELNFFAGPYFFIHWLGIIATTFIVVSTPIYYFLKRVKMKKLKILLKIHIFGNLIAFLPISIHFAQNVGRLAGAPQRLGDGFVLFLILLIVLATGIIERYGPNSKLGRNSRFAHKYSIVILFFIALIHVLEGVNLIFFI